MKLTNVFLRFFLVILLALFCLTGFVIFELSPVSRNASVQEFIIGQNDDASLEGIAAKLYFQGLIHSPRFFTFIAGLQGAEGKIHAGGYQLSKSMEMGTILDELLNHQYSKWVTLVPKLRKEEVAEKLTAALSWEDATREEFLQNAIEGRLYPDTYLIPFFYSGKQVALMLRDNFDQKIAPFASQIAANHFTEDQIITIASLVEREAADSSPDGDGALIAQIIINRLNIGMRLQLDSTLAYARGKSSSGYWWGAVSASDKQINSLYNTYTHSGLTPGPIDSPRITAIESVLQPQATDCLYFLHDSLGEIHCAVTYEEHLKNIQAYLK